MTEQVVEGFELSRQQRRIWSMQDNGDAFQSQCAILLEGALNKRALRQALQIAIASHEILRTSFRSLSGMKFPIQVISEDADAPALNECDLNCELEELLLEELRTPFDLDAPSLIRCKLLNLSQDRHVLILGQPALCADAE